VYAPAVPPSFPHGSGTAVTGALLNGDNLVAGFRSPTRLRCNHVAPIAEPDGAIHPQPIAEDQQVPAS
jgi:hypothetical protein